MNLPEATRSRLKHQHLVLEDLIGGLTGEQLNKEVYAGKWTIHQQLAHLASYNHTFLTRIHIIMETFNARFDPYLADNDPEFLLACQMETPELLNYFKKGSKKITDLIFSLNTSELIRTGIHAHYGNLSVLMWTEFYLLHEAHHIYGVFRMVNELKNLAAIPGK
ncbi:MAG: DinB family protein [Daejeonella sp.]